MCQLGALNHSVFPFGLCNSPCTFHSSLVACVVITFTFVCYTVDRFVHENHCTDTFLEEFTFNIRDFYFQQTPKATPPPSPSLNVQSVLMTDTEHDEGPTAELDLCIGPKDAYVVEVKLIEQSGPSSFGFVTIQHKMVFTFHSFVVE